MTLLSSLRQPVFIAALHPLAGLQEQLRSARIEIAYRAQAEYNEVVDLAALRAFAAEVWYQAGGAEWCRAMLDHSAVVGAHVCENCERGVLPWQPQFTPELHRVCRRDAVV